MGYFKNADDGVYWTLFAAVAAASPLCFLINAAITSDTEAVKMARMGYEEKVEIYYSELKYPTVVKHWVRSVNCTGDSVNE